MVGDETRYSGSSSQAQDELQARKPAEGRAGLYETDMSGDREDDGRDRSAPPRRPVGPWECSGHGRPREAPSSARYCFNGYRFAISFQDA